VTGSVFAIAHLDQNGVPTLSTFTAKLGDIAAGLAKLQVGHTASAPAVDVQLKGSGKVQRRRSRTSLPVDRASPRSFPPIPTTSRSSQRTVERPCLRGMTYGSRATPTLPSLQWEVWLAAALPWCPSR
jgi:hypothetical protein